MQELIPAAVVILVLGFVAGWFAGAKVQKTALREYLVGSVLFYWFESRDACARLRDPTGKLMAAEQEFMKTAEKQVRRLIESDVLFIEKAEKSAG